MAEVSYDSKQLLIVLKEIEQNLEHAMTINGLDSNLFLENAIEGFLTNHELKGEEISYINTKIVFQYLKYEGQKVGNVIIEVHDLRAYEEFLRCI